MLQYRKTKLTIQLCAIAVLAACGSARQNSGVTGFGGGWTAVNPQKPAVKEPLATKELQGPGDTSRTSKQQVSHLAQIRKDIQYITSKESIDKLKTEINETISDTNPYDESATKLTKSDYFRSSNIVLSLVLGAVGLIALFPFPILGFTLLLFGVLFGVAGLYYLRHPDAHQE